MGCFGFAYGLVLVVGRVRCWEAADRIELGSRSGTVRPQSQAIRIGPMRGSAGLHAKDAMSGKAEVSPQAMRAFLASLGEAGDLKTIAEPVDLEFEIAACLAEADGGPALRFDAVRDHRLPVVGNVLTSLPRIAAGSRHDAGGYARHDRRRRSIGRWSIASSAPRRARKTSSRTRYSRTSCRSRGSSSMSAAPTSPPAPSSPRTG